MVLRAFTLALVLRQAHLALGQACTPPDANRIVSCFVTGPAEGVYTFPVGVGDFRKTFAK